MSFKELDKNSKIRANDNASLFLYGYLENEVNQIQKMCKKGGIDNVNIIPYGYEHSIIGNIIDGNCKKLEEDKIDEKVILINGLSDFDITFIIKNYRTLNLGSPLMAVVTEHSIKWRFKDLVCGLQEERAEFEKMRKE